MLAELTHPDDLAVQRAVSAAAELPPVDACADPIALRRRPRPSLDGFRERGEVRTLLSRAAAASLAGRYAEGLLAAEQALARAHNLDLAPLVAEAKFVLGTLLDQAGQYEPAEQMLAQAYVLAGTAVPAQLVRDKPEVWYNPAEGKDRP